MQNLPSWIENYFDSQRKKHLDHMFDQHRPAPSETQYRKYFRNIGISYLLGSIFGGVYALTKAAKIVNDNDIKGLAAVDSVRLKCLKKHKVMGPSCGLAALIYSMNHIGLTYITGVESEVHIPLAATLTGYMHQYTRGPGRMIVAGFAGMVVGSVVALHKGRTKIWKEWREATIELRRILTTGVASFFTQPMPEEYQPPFLMLD